MLLTSPWAVIRPSVKRKPTASAKSSPGVRMVTATLRCFDPGSSTRISSGSSVARLSRLLLRAPSSTLTTSTRVVLLGRLISTPSLASAASFTGISELVGQCADAGDAYPIVWFAREDLPCEVTRQGRRSPVAGGIRHGLRKREQRIGLVAPQSVRRRRGGDPRDDCVIGLYGHSRSLLRFSALHVLVAESTLHAEVAAGDAVIERRGDLNDLVVLHVQFEAAADPAVGADRFGHRLRGRVPGSGGAHVVLALEHECAGGTHRDAVAAVDASRFGKRRCELGCDARIEPTPRDRDREGVLPVAAAGLDALVTKDALRVVADVVFVVDLDRLGHGFCGLSVAGMVVARSGAVSGAGRGGWCGRAVAFVARAILCRPALDVRRSREIDARGEELEHHLAAVADTIRCDAHHHAV